MSHSVTETDTFDSPVTVPDEDDTASAASVEDPFQALANRTKFLNTKAAYTLSGSALANGDPVTFADLGLAGGAGFVLSDSDTKIQVPSTGWYKVTISNIPDAAYSAAPGDDNNGFRVKVDGSEPSPTIRSRVKFGTVVGLLHITDATKLITLIHVRVSSTVNITGGVLMLEKVG